MRNAKKTLSLVMTAIFTTFIVLSGIPAGAVTTAQAKAQVAKATAAVVKVEKYVKIKNFAPTTATSQNNVAKTELAKVRKLGKAYTKSYVALNARIAKVAKAIATRNAVIAKAKAAAALLAKNVANAEKAVEAAEAATTGDDVDLVGNETALANAQSAVTTALELIVKLDPKSSNYKGLMARVEAANNLVMDAIDEINAAAAAAQAEADAKAKAEADAKALAEAVAAADTAVKAVEAAPLVTEADVTAALALGVKAADAVKAVTDTTKAAEFAARLKVVADKGQAVLDMIAAKAAADAEALKPATVKGIVAVDGTITVTFDKKPLTTPAAADFVITKVVTTTSAVTTTVTGTVNVVSDTAVTITVPAVAAILGADQSVVYSVVYNATGAAVTAAAFTVAKTPELTATIEVLNLKQVKINFSKAVDATEGAKLTNYFVGADSTTNLADGAGATVVLATDNKSAVVTLENGANLANSSTANYVKVLKAVGFTADYTNAAVAATDAALPTLVSVAQSGPKTIDLVFSEPLNRAVSAANTVASFTLDAGAVTLDPSVATYVDSTRTLTIGTYTPMTAGKHTLAIKAPASSNLVDYAGYKPLASTTEFTYVADTTIPTVSVVSSTETTATIKFNKAVKDVVGNGNLLFSHTYNSSAYQVTGAAVTNPSGDNMTFVVNFGTAKPFIPGTSTLYIGYTSTTGTLVTDLYGNSLGSTSLTITTTVDTVKPTVTSVVFTNATTLTVTFSENVDATTAQTATNYTLKDSAGTAVAVSAAVLASNVVTLTTATLVGGSYTLAIANVKDSAVAGNVMITGTYTIAATDTIAPTVTDKDTVTVGTQVNQVSSTQVKVEFSEAMDPAFLADKANWQYDGNALLTDDTITVASDNKSVVVKIAAGVDAAKNLTLGHVKDVAGNYIASFQTTLDIAAVAEITYKTITATGKDTVTVAFDEAITGAVAADFEIAVDGATYAACTGFSGVSTVDGKTTITLVTPDQTTTDGSLVRVRTVADTQGVNAFGTEIGFNVGGAGVTPVDGYVPNALTTADMTTMDVDHNGQIDHIKLVFSEAMKAGLVSADKFTVAGYTVSDAYASSTAPTAAAARTGATVGDDTDIYLQVDELTTGTDTAATPTVTIAAGLKDLAGNAFAAQAALATTDKAAPVLLSITGDAANATAGWSTGDIVYFNYSEAVTLLGNDNAAGGAAAAADITTATATLTTTTTAGDPITVAGIATLATAAAEGAANAAVAAGAITLTNSGKTIKYTVGTVATATQGNTPATASVVAPGTSTVYDLAANGAVDAGTPATFADSELN